jgi:hypothetical protein
VFLVPVALATLGALVLAFAFHPPTAAPVGALEEL